MTEYNYHDFFTLQEPQEIINFLNYEQSLFGRITYIEADDVFHGAKGIVITKIKYDKTLKLYNVKNICHKSIACHIKFIGCELALIFGK
jgi:hypothetical protein